MYVIETCDIPMYVGLIQYLVGLAHHLVSLTFNLFGSLEGGRYTEKNKAAFGKNNIGMDAQPLKKSAIFLTQDSFERKKN